MPLRDLRDRECVHRRALGELHAPLEQVARLIFKVMVLQAELLARIDMNDLTDIDVGPRVPNLIAPGFFDSYWEVFRVVELLRTVARRLYPETAAGPPGSSPKDNLDYFLKF